MKIKTAKNAVETPVPQPAKKSAAKPATAKAAPAPEATAPARVGKNIGRTSGMRIMQYQDHTMAAQLKNKLTDEELGQNWAEEFPDARCQFAERMDIVRIVRKLFNEGRHGKQEITSDQPIPKYEIQNGKRVAVEETPRQRGAKKPAA